MKIVVDLNDDDIRKEIKKMIREQVISIVRDEYREVIETEIKSKLKKSLTPTSWQLREGYMSIAREKFNTTEFEQAIAKMIDEKVNLMAKGLNLKKEVQNAIEKKLNSTEQTLELLKGFQIEVIKTTKE